MILSILHGQHSNMPTVGLWMVHKNNFHGRGSNDYLYSSNKEGPLTGHQHPKLAAILAARNHQDMRIIGVPYPSDVPGHASALNSGAGHTMQNMHNEAAGGPPFSNNAITKPLFFGSTYISGLSPAKLIVSSMKFALRMTMVLLRLQLSRPWFPSQDIERGAISSPEKEHMSYAKLLLAHLQVQQLV